MIIRPVDLPADRTDLLNLDTSFVTGRIYTVVAAPASFSLVESTVEPPLHKSFPLQEELGDDRLWDQGFVAVNDGAIVGFAAVRHEVWNHRADIWHLYVAPEQRGRGVGRLLLAAVTAYAQQIGARCLWLETSNVNYPAIQFYRRAGFRWCGLDQALYTPDGEAPGETALFFTRDLAVTRHDPAA